MHAVVQRLAANMAGAGNTVTPSDAMPREEQLSEETTSAVNVWVGRIDGAFRRQELATAFAYARAGVHRHGAASEKLSKRWLCMLDLLAARAQPHKTQPSSKWPPPPPEVLSLRKLLEELPDELKAELKGLAGEGSTRPGRRFKCVLLRERSTIVVGLSEPEWQVCWCHADKVKLIGDLKEAVVHGLDGKDATHATKTLINMTAAEQRARADWAIRLCTSEQAALDAAGEGLYAALKSTCLIRRAALHLSQREFEPALEAASEALALAPHSKNAGSLLASAQHKAGKKKAASSTLCGLCALFVADEVAEPSITGTHEDRWDEALERTVGLLLDCNRSKDALKLLNALAARVDSLAGSSVFRIVAELCVRHGLKKDALHSKLFSLCAAAPDEATLAFLHAMTLALPAAVEQQLVRYADALQPGELTLAPQLLGVLSRLPDNADQAETLRLLLRLASRVSPDQPADLSVVFTELRRGRALRDDHAYGTALAPRGARAERQEVAPAFAAAAATLLRDFLAALSPSAHAASEEAWSLPSELMTKAYDGAPPAEVAAELRRAVLRVPPAQEALLWAALRPLGPAGDCSMAAVLRAWWEHHDPSDVGAMERAANELQAKHGFAAALDLVRWAEGTGRRVSQVKIGDWDALHHRVLRGCAEERCKAAVRVNNIDIEICADAPALAEPSRKTDRGAAASRMVAWEESGSRSIRLDKVNGHASLGHLCVVVWELLYAHGHARPEAPEDLVLHDEAARAPEPWRTVLDLVATGDPSRPRLRVQLTWAVGATCRREQRLPMRAHPTTVDLPERQRTAAEDERRAAGLQSAHADVHLTTEALQHCEARGWVGFVSMADPAGLVSGAILAVGDLTEAEATLLHARENMASDALAHGDHVLTVASGHGAAHSGLASVPRGYHASREAIKAAAAREATAHPPAHSLSVAELAIVEAAAAGSDADAPARARHRAAAAAAAAATTRPCAEGSRPTGGTASASAGAAEAESGGRRERKRQQLGRGMPSAGALGKLLPPDVIKSLASLAKDTAQLPPRRPGAAAARPLDLPAQGGVEPATITAPDASGKIRITADGASSPAARLQALAAAGLALSRPRAPRDDTDSDATLGPLSGGSSDEGAPLASAEAARPEPPKARPEKRDKPEPWAEEAAAGKNVPTNATPGSALPDEEHTLRLKVASSWGSELFFKMTDDMPMGRLIKACCERMCVDPRGAVFTVPRKKVKGADEAKELKNGAEGAASSGASEATEAKPAEGAEAERVRVGRSDTPASLGLRDGDLIELEVDPEYKWSTPGGEAGGREDGAARAERERAQAAAKANEIAMQLMAEEQEAKEKEGRKARKAKAKQEEAAKAAQGKRAAAKLQREAEEEEKRQKAAARQAELEAAKQAAVREEAEQIARAEELAARDQAARQEAAKEEAAAARARQEAAAKEEAARARREASEEAQARREAQRLAKAAEAEARAAAAASAAAASAASYRGLAAGGSGLAQTFRSLSPVDLQNEPAWQGAPGGLPTPVGGGTCRSHSRSASGDAWPKGAAGAHPLWEAADISQLWADEGPREGLPHLPSGALDFATADARAVGGASAPAVGSAALGGATLVPLGGRDIAADAPGGPGGLAGVQLPSGVGCGLRYTHEQLAAATQGFADASACNRRGTVHRGVLAASATPVAVKRVPPSGRGPRSETARRAEERARSEASLLARAAHPNVVALLGFSDDGPAPCLVLGLMAGGSLQRRLGASGGGLEPLPPAARLSVLSDVARALAHLHAACGLAHGGLGAASVLLSHPPPGGLPEARLGGFEDAAEHGTLGEHSPAARADCLAYGLLVLEVLTALPATALAAAPTEELAHARAGLAASAAQMHHSLAELVRRLDSRAGGGSVGVWDEAIEAGVVHALHAAVQRCLEPRLELRASMRALLPETERLRGAAERMGAGRRARRAASAAPGAPLPWSSSWPLAQPPALQSLGECVVCLENSASHILVPCGHCCCCEACGDALLRSSRLCPVCQGESREAVRVFLV